jgi:hypothetical protein
MTVVSKMRSSVALVTLAALAMLMPARALAAPQPAILCVNPGGTGGCFSKIQDAINATGKAGALINVDDGTYFENLIIPKIKLILQGTGQNANLIDNFSIPNVAIAAGAQVTIANLSIAEGLNNSGAGCIESAAKSLVLNNLSIFLCQGTRGGMIHQVGGSLTIVNSGISGGTASGDGGCIAMEGGKLSLQSVELSFCAADGDGGAIWLSNTNASIMKVKDDLPNIHDNRASGSGGAIFAAGGKLAISGIVFSSNNAINGDGGAIDSSAPLTITGSDFEENHAHGDGGAILAMPPGKLTISNSGVADNSSFSDGGGIAAETGFSLLNVLVFDNLAQERGGGVFALGSGKISSLTIDVNEAIGDGGGIDVASGAVKITNTIVAPNVTGGSGPDCAGSLSSQGFNLIFDTAGCSISGQTATNIVGLDPKLAAPGHFDEVLIQRPLAGSPVLGAGGHCPKTDELLNPRPHTGCAIGAIESP